MERSSDKVRRMGTLCVAMAAIFYSIGGLFIKIVPWNAMSINGARTLIGVVVIGTFIKLTGRKIRFNRWVLLGALCVTSTNILYSFANKLTTAANAIVLQYTAPIFVMVMGVLFLKRRTTRLDIITCVLVLAGVVCFFIDGLSIGGMLGNILALISGVTYAGVFMLNDFPDGDPLSSSFWGLMISGFVGLPSLVQETNFSATAILGILVLGLFQIGAGYICISVGLKHTPSVTASLVGGIEPVLNPIWVAIFYGEMVGPLALVGAVIVIGSILAYNVIQDKQNPKAENNTECITDKGETI